MEIKGLRPTREYFHGYLDCLSAKLGNLRIIYTIYRDIRTADRELKVKKRPHFLPIMLTNLNRNRLNVLSSAFYQLLNCHPRASQQQGKNQSIFVTKIVQVINRRQCIHMSEGWMAIESWEKFNEGRETNESEEEAIAVEAYRCMVLRDCFRHTTLVTS